MEEGKKFDGEKLRFDLIPPSVERALASVLTYGAKKYDDRNWENGIKFSRIYGAVRRHLNSFWDGTDIDSESGMPHLWHALCGIAFLISYEAEGSEYDGYDDRPRERTQDNEVHFSSSIPSSDFSWNSPKS